MKRLIPALLMAASFGVAAQAYPTKPIRIVASYPPGGTNDFVARSVGQKLSEMLGQQVLVDNRSGAGGNIGADSVAKAAPDGYTLFMAAGAHALAPSLYKKLSYDLVKDFAHISIASQAAFVLVVNPSVPANSAKDLIQYIKGQHVIYAHPKMVEKCLKQVGRKLEQGTWLHGSTRRVIKETKREELTVRQHSLQISRA